MQQNYRLIVATTWEQQPAIGLAALRTFVHFVPANADTTLVFVTPQEPNEQDVEKVQALLAHVDAPKICPNIEIESITEACAKSAVCVVYPQEDEMTTAIMMNEFLQCVQSLARYETPRADHYQTALATSAHRLADFASRCVNQALCAPSALNPSQIIAHATTDLATNTPFIAQLRSNDPRLTVGRYTYGGAKFHFSNEDNKVEIGSFCSIACDVTIFGGGEHQATWITTYPLRLAFGDVHANFDGQPHAKGPTIIGNDVWIATGATIMSGVTIGHGAVIGAYAVVAKDVPPYAIVVGNPAKELRKRFSDDQISRLLALQWWNWPIEKIREHTALLCSTNVEKVLSLQI